MIKKFQNLGFTLVELLVVIAIIGLLASVVLVALNSSRQRARDARRLADIKQVRSGLEVYFTLGNGYPDQAAWNAAQPTGAALACSGAGALSKVPQDPYNSSNAAYSYVLYSQWYWLRRLWWHSLPKFLREVSY